jgi:hypothetical protein
MFKLYYLLLSSVVDLDSSADPDCPDCLVSGGDIQVSLRNSQVAKASTFQVAQREIMTPSCYSRTPYLGSCVSKYMRSGLHINQNRYEGSGIRLPVLDDEPSDEQLLLAQR